MNWTSQQVEAHNARRNNAALKKAVAGGLSVESPVASVGVDDESELHYDILVECNRRGWIALHSRMDRRTTTNVGAPDFVIVSPGGVLFVEAKTRLGKLTTEQLGMKYWMEKLGAHYHVVRSMSDFLKLL